MFQKTTHINSKAIERDLCKKLEQIRLLKNISQAKLAEAAGVSRRTISRMENGEGISLDTFIRVMQALNLTDHLTAMLPNPEIRPIERVGRKGKYQPEFVRSGIQVAPLTMRLAEGTFEFPSLAKETFKGLPGLLADSLPDKFGNAVIDAWLATQGRDPDSLNPVERLCYIGTRGMGALEFKPATAGAPTSKQNLQVEQLVKLANRVLNSRESLQGEFTGDDDAEAIQDILRVGTSAGGARAKAILAWNEETGEFRSGQVDLPDGFTQWLIKFDGISKNKDKELNDPQGYGQIEYAYYLMALEAGIEMNRCRLHNEGGRSHFMTERFDRTEKNAKLHMQSLGAIQHFDFNQAGAYSYEQAIRAMLKLNLSPKQVEQQFRRATFNVIARNQDNHVKNIAFLMNREG